MNFTKFGVSTVFLCVLAYVAAYFGAVYAIAFFVFAMVTGLEKEVKINAAQAAVLGATFSILGSILSVLSEGYVTVLSSLPGFMYNFSNWMIQCNLFSFCYKALNIIEIIVLLACLLFAAKGKIVKLPIISKMVEKHVQ